MTDIGTIVASNDHLTYLCRVYGPLEVAKPPQRTDYALGMFVAIPLDSSGEVQLVGLITDSVLINPDYGNFAPRLSSQPDLEVFSPDAINERGILLTVRLLGTLSGIQASHDIPVWVADVGTSVSSMELENVWAFHRTADGGFMIGYYPRLMALRDQVIQRVLLATLEALAPSFPEDRPLIDLLRGNLAWQADVGPFE